LEYFENNFTGDYVKILAWADSNGNTPEFGWNRGGVMSRKPAIALKPQNFGVFLLYQIVDVGVSLSQNLKIISREIIFEVLQPV